MSDILSMFIVFGRRAESGELGRRTESGELSFLPSGHLFLPLHALLHCTKVAFRQKFGLNFPSLI